MLVAKRQSSDGGCLLINRLVGRSKNSRSRGGSQLVELCRRQGKTLLLIAAR
ncbi:hypothetical protein DY000_02040308 [Brassica cretica]|uniref:Uncharacterized protein n=1 Tax=Brassica cretica TaxID=69181 RepID=A0ABQ7B5I6_BRACR|nr:hypothetical protein DY000_02040308 [Brassica cretica]